MDPLEQALSMLDESCAIIQELVAQLQATSNQDTMSKKAEELAVKLGLSFDDASDIIKVAGTNGEIDSFVKIAEKLKNNVSFGSVYEENRTISSSGSAAIDNYIEKQAAIMEELGL